ncbi:MAG: hypothetical protein M1832_002151 [Thelocarpon impressellum]|nr:MAG: hypothetical protein M1832_002151 [Thelocarpon impressellum]
MSYSTTDARRRSGSSVSGGGRWDPERFHRERDRVERGGGRFVEERDRIDRSGGHFHEEREYHEEDFGSPAGGRDRFGRGGDRFGASVQVRRRERSADGPFNRFGGARRSSGYYDDDDSFDSSPSARYGRSGSRISSLSRDSRSGRTTLPHHFDREVRRESITVPFRPAPRPRRSPPPRRYEREYEEIRIAEPDYYGDEEFHGMRDIEIDRRGSTTSRFAYRREDDFDEGLQQEQPFPRRGKTKMPRRIVHVDAITALGYPYVDEGETIIILKALSGEQIDEVVRVSEELRKTSYRFEETRMIPAPPSPPAEIYERTVEHVVAAPIAPDAGIANREANNDVVDLRAVLIKATKVVEEVEESNTVRGPLTALALPEKHIHTHELIIPERRKDERSLKNEIRTLEREEKALRLERKAAREERKARRIREGRDQYVELEVERDDGVKVERNSKVPADSRLVKAMLATLT